MRDIISRVIIKEKGVIKIALSTFKRYELKYTITAEQATELKKEIVKYMVPDAYCTDGRMYSIYNLYFDNDQDSVIRRSVEKPYFKEKLRLRSYYPSPEPDTPVYFEIKRKINKTVTKRRATVTYEQSKQFLTDYKAIELPKYIDTRVLREVEYFVKTYEVYPKVYIRYDRQAFFGKDDKEFRLTFDKNIHTRRYDLDFGHGDDGDLIIPENYRLMEVKISGALPLWLIHAMDELDIHQTSFSKYGKEFTDIYLPGADAGLI